MTGCFDGLRRRCSQQGNFRCESPPLTALQEKVDGLSQFLHCQVFISVERVIVDWSQEVVCCSSYPGSNISQRPVGTISICQPNSWSTRHDHASTGFGIDSAMHLALPFEVAWAQQ